MSINGQSTIDGATFGTSTQPDIPPTGHDYIFHVDAANDPDVVAQLRAELGAVVVETTQDWGFELWRTQTDLDPTQLATLGAAGLEFLSTNLTVTASDIAGQASGSQGDPSNSKLWGLDNSGQTGGTVDADIDAQEAWELSRGSGVVVAVIDTGVDYTHEDLIDNMWVNTGEIAGNGIDDDGNGFVDDVHGYNFANNSSDPMDRHSHGTHVAGTIAATGDNGIGITGVAPEAQIMALKFINDSGSGSLFDAIQALEYAVMMGAQVSNNSWGGGSFSHAMSSALALAGDAGHTFVAAAGNDSVDITTDPHYPASYDAQNLISVGASNHNDRLAYFSNYSFTDVDVIAPGQTMYSTLPGDGYGYNSGTSMAAPHVTGTVALMLAMDPTLTPDEIRTTLIETSDPVAALASRSQSSGRMNAAAAVEAVEHATISGRILDATGVAMAGWTVFLDADGNGRRGAGETVAYTDATGRYVFTDLNAGAHDVIAEITPGHTLAAPSEAGVQVTATTASSEYRTTVALAWRDITSTADTVTGGDEGHSTLALPFDMPWFGTSYNRLYISPNGALSFATPSALNRVPHITPAPSAAILPFWTDLTTDHGGAIRVLSDPDAGMVVVHYDGLRGADGTGLYDFQVIMTAQGDVSLRYHSMSDVPEDVLIGLVAPGGATRVDLDPAMVLNTGGVRLTQAPQTRAVQTVTAQGASEAQDIIVETLGGPTQNLSGQVWLDSDGDGLWDRGETAVAAHMVYLDMNGDGIWSEGEAWTLSDVGGAYQFDGLSPGQYAVRLAPNQGWTPTAVGTDSYRVATTTQFDLWGTGTRWASDQGAQTQLQGLGDDGALEVDLPFLFPFFGTGYDTLTVSTNGYITFGGTGHVPENTSLSGATLPGPMIAAFWDDLHADSGTVSVQFATGSEEVAILYSDVRPYEGAGSYSFRIVLYGTGRIELAYDAMVGPTDGATVGIADGTGTAALELYHNQAGLTDDMVFVFDPVAADDTGTEAVVSPGYDIDGVDLGVRPDTVTTPDALHSGTFEQVLTTMSASDDL